MQPTLSILITTFNRSFFLEKLLNSILNNSNFLNEIEIVIFNNGSNDNTNEVIEKFKKKFPILIYEQVEDTLDFTGGYFKLLELGHGRFFWFIGDDDYITKNFDSLISLLKTENPDIVLLNHSLYLQENGADREKKIRKTNFLFASKETKKFNNYIDFIKNVKHINGFFTHISTTICKKSSLESFINMEILHKYDNSNSHHIYLYLSVLKNSSSIYYIHDVFICLRVGSSYGVWDNIEGRLFRIKMGSEYFLKMVEDVFSEKAIINLFKNLILKKDLSIVLIGAKLKLKNVPFSFYLKIISNLYNDYKRFPAFWFLILPISLLPSFVYKISFRVWKMIKEIWG